MKKGDVVWFKPHKGKPMQAELRTVMGNGVAEIKIGSDPFPVSVQVSQLSEVSDCDQNGKVVSSKSKARMDRAGRKGKAMPKTETGPSAKELRKQAQGLGIKGWEDMGRKQLRKAIKRAKNAQNGSTDTATEEKSVKSKPKKAPAKKASKPKASSTKPKASKPAAKPAPKKASAKAAAKPAANDTPGLTFAKSHPKPTPDHGVNPFRKNSALFRVAKLLLKGGKRETLASKLSEQVELHPYQKDEVDLLDYDKRLLLGAQTMRDKFGYGILRTGRGLDGTILVFVPGGPNDPRGKASKSKAKKK